ncbi:hypothetical protein [Streptomyces sp. ODS28]|uniref:hypothetical protein n=1 Tax=Streptomyces sp. ODS28 TaxID=3136688 RepID=UPI0031EC18BB
MKTQERNAAGANRGVAGGSPGGERLPTASRERKPALAALAVLLVLLGALGTTLLVMRAGDREEAIVITKQVPRGQPVPESAIKSVMVAKDEGVNYVRWDQRSQLTKFRAATDLLPGTVMVGGMLSEDRGLNRGQVVVGLSLKAGQYPAGLRAGDSVAAYRSSTTGSSGASAGAKEPITDSATVQSVSGGGEGVGASGTKTVSVVVNESAAPDLASASNGGVSLVITPGSGG